MPTSARTAAPDLRLLAALAFAQLVAWGSTYYLFAVVLEPVRADLGLSRSVAAGAYGVGLLVMGVAALPVGWWIDRGRQHTVLVGGSLLCVVGLALHAWVTSAWQLYAVWMLLGLGMAASLYEPVFAFLIRAYPHDYRRRITLVTLLGGLASSVFWPLIAWLVHQWGWRQAMIALAVIHAIGCLVVHYAMVPRGDIAGPHLGKPAQPALALIRSPVFLWLSLAFVLQTLVLGAVAGHVIDLLVASGAPTAWAITAASSIGVLQVAGRVVLMMTEARWGAAHTARWVIWLLPASLLALAAAGFSVAFMFIFAALYGTGNGMMTIVKGTAAADMLSREHVATLNGALAVPMAFARAAGPVVLAWAWDVSGHHGISVAVMMALALAGAVALGRAAHLAALGRPTIVG